MRGWAPWGQEEEGYRPTVYYYGQRRPKGLTFSTTELGHLGIALAVLTAVFTMFLGGFNLQGFGYLENANIIDSSLHGELAPWHIALVSLVAAGTGFLLHEMAHKVVAQRFGLWAEFRAFYGGLLLALLITYFTGFIFAAPGAVMISGFVNRRDNGLISLAGPLTNILIALIALPFAGLGPADSLGQLVAKIVMLVNAILALFNLIPLGNLDGKKVLRWNVAGYLGIVALGVATLLQALGVLT